MASPDDYKENIVFDHQEKEVWFVTGSQHLYGPGPLEQVAEDSKVIAEALSRTERIPVKVIVKPVVTRADEVRKVCLEANNASNCIGLVAWMHTFSPAKMWIAGLHVLNKPIAHFHTQFNRDIPWDSIDMDFMNLNQSAHGGREFGFIGARMQINRKVIVGFWKDPEVLQELGVWIRAACAWDDAQNLKVARIGDNMREVAVTEGNKVSAQLQFGYSVNGFGLGDLVAFVNQVTDQEAEELLQEYDDKYTVQEDLLPGGARRGELKEAAKIEIGLRAFLEDGDFKAFTTTFENLHGLAQLPGLSIQRLMMDGFGFGAEGDWKTAALLRAMKVMAAGLEGGTSFMEDYTYHFEPGNNLVLGAHMLEICESISNGKPSLEMHPLGIGGKADPARLIFNAPAGPAINVSIIDLGHRFRMLVNEVEAIKPPQDLPKLPVARAVWKPLPNLKVGAAAWILAGGAHHTGFSMALTTEYIEDFAEMAGIEMVVIDAETTLRVVKQELKWNEVCFRIS